MDYELKYLKYKKKYIDFKNNKYGGEHIYIENNKWDGKWKDEDKKYDGKIDGEITVDLYNKKKIEKEGDGVWDGSWNPEKNNYIGTFTDRTNNKQDVDIVGRWVGNKSFIDKKFYGIRKNKKPENKPIDLKGLEDINFKENEKYSLKSFITLKKLEQNEYFKNFISDIDNNDYDYWTIKRLNYFDDQDGNDFKKLKKNFEQLLGKYKKKEFVLSKKTKELFLSDSFDDIFFDEIIPSIFCYFEFYRLQYGSDLQINQILDNFYMSQKDMLDKLCKKYIYHVNIEEDADLNVDNYHNFNNYGDDIENDLFETKFYLIYIDKDEDYYM